MICTKCGSKNAAVVKAGSDKYGSRWQEVKCPECGYTFIVHKLAAKGISCIGCTYKLGNDCTKSDRCTGPVYVDEEGNIVTPPARSIQHKKSDDLPDELVINGVKYRRVD